jgi:aconitate decarboxylase
LTTRVRLTLKDGSTREKVVAHPRGTGDRALSDADIVDKYRGLTRTVISEERQRKIENTVLNLEALEDISELTALLTPTVASALG